MAWALTDEELDGLRGLLRGLGLAVHSGAGRGHESDHACNAMSQLSTLMILAPHAYRLQTMATAPAATPEQRFDDEIGAMKNTISQLVDQMNSSIETVQRAINELREEREVLALSRTLEADQDYGALS